MKIVIACLLLAGYLWTDAAIAQEEDQVGQTAAMCAAIYYAGVTNSSPEVRDILYERADWWLKFTTAHAVEVQLDVLLNIIESSIENGNLESFQKDYKAGLQACNTLMDEAKAEAAERE